MTTRSLPAFGKAVGGMAAVLLAHSAIAQSTPTLDWQLRQVGASPRIDHALAWLETTNTTYLFGGSDSQTSPPSDAFFSFDGMQLQTLTPPTRPAARRGHTMVHDPVRRRLVLFGGQGAALALLSDTWEWDGANWTQIQTPQAPSARHGHGMEFDHSTGRVLLFGGETAGGVSGETWTYDGATWTQVAGTAPAARRHHVLASTFVAGVPQLVLFGGDNGVALLQDTWTFDGTAWSLASPLRSPPARRSAVMVHHTLLDAPLLLGGEDGDGPLADSWRWSAGNWSPVPVSTSGIGARAQHAATYDSARGLVVLHGGTGSLSVSFREIFEGRLPGLVGRMVSYGQGCGPVPPGVRLSPSSSAGVGIIPGGSATVIVVPSITATIGVVNLGFDAQRYGPLALPLDLTPLGMTGCALLASIEANLPIPRPPFGQFITVQIPNDRSLGGIRFYLQAALFDQPANPAGIVTSNGVEVQVGFEQASTPLVEVVETFANASQLESDVSSGTWGNGAGRFGPLGLDGLHGAFVADDGVMLSSGVFQWNTDLFTIPAHRTTSGRAEVVTDGVFRFTEFVLPADRTVVFTGSRPVRIHVRGRVDVRGQILCNGADLEAHNRTLPAGQNGGLGGPGGGVGGRGAYRASGAGTSPLFNGGDGSDVLLVAGHAYGSARIGTGGRGSLQIPSSGLNSAVTFNLLGGSGSGMIAAGGGGGGYSGPGQAGRALFNGTTVGSDLGAPAPGGTAFQLFPLPPVLGGTQRLEHFLIGGSGGGGGGGHPFFSIRTVPPDWKSGGAGTGGGGAIAVRVGGALNIAAGATIEARGGNGPGNLQAPPAAPGGGGSGGSILLQVAGGVTQAGLLNVLGGRASWCNDRLAFQVETRGGDGAPGFARLELNETQPPLSRIGAVQPPATAGAVDMLTDSDALTGFQSKWYWDDAPLLARWQSIVIDTTVGGVPVRFSDGPGGVRPGFGQPLQVYLQGAKFDPMTGQVITGSEGPWRTGVSDSGGSLTGDGATAVRFQLICDRRIGGEVVIQRVSITYLR